MGSEKFVHRLGGIVTHVVEDVSVAAEHHRWVSMAEHPGDRVERNALLQGQSASGVTQVMKADLRRKAGLP